MTRESVERTNSVHLYEKRKERKEKEEKGKTIENMNMSIWYGKRERKKERKKKKGCNLISDPPSVVFQGELWQRHLWPGVQRVVSMVIVALLKEGVVCCLVMTGEG